MHKPKRNFCFGLMAGCPTWRSCTWGFFITVPIPLFFHRPVANPIDSPVLWW